MCISYHFCQDIYIYLKLISKKDEIKTFKTRAPIYSIQKPNVIWNKDFCENGKSGWLY